METDYESALDLLERGGVTEPTERHRLANIVRDHVDYLGGRAPEKVRPARDCRENAAIPERGIEVELLTDREKWMESAGQVHLRANGQDAEWLHALVSDLLRGNGNAKVFLRPTDDERYWRIVEKSEPGGIALGKVSPFVVEPDTPEPGHLALVLHARSWHATGDANRTPWGDEVELDMTRHPRDQIDLGDMLLVKNKADAEVWGEVVSLGSAPTVSFPGAGQRFVGFREILRIVRVPPADVISDILGLVGVTVDPKEISKKWTTAQMREAGEWASLEHLAASDPVRRKKRPAFLPEPKSPELDGDRIWPAPPPSRDTQPSSVPPQPPRTEMVINHPEIRRAGVSGMLSPNVRLSNEGECPTVADEVLYGDEWWEVDKVFVVGDKHDAVLARDFHGDRITTSVVLEAIDVWRRRKP